SCSFLLSYSRSHRLLHSFPTRRSSDLSRARTYAPCFRTGGFSSSTRRSRSSRRGSCSRTLRRGSQARSPGCSSRECPSLARSSRSEEHTSELQSLAYLVCRLLLEKKKH